MWNDINKLVQEVASKVVELQHTVTSQAAELRQTITENARLKEENERLKKPQDYVFCCAGTPIAYFSREDCRLTSLGPKKIDLEDAIITAKAETRSKVLSELREKLKGAFVPVNAEISIGTASFYWFDGKKLKELGLL